MKNLLTPSRTLAAVLLVGGWTCAQGQSLGTPVADVLLGRPLDMSLPARFASTDSADECVHADVFYGESRLKAADVRTSITGPADRRHIRVEAALPINEPVVTVSVRAGCRNTVTRNYTLLPEYPSERLLAALDARAAVAAAAPAAPLKLAQATAPAGPGPRKSAAARQVVARAAADAAPPPKARSTRAARKTVVAAGPRLKLEPIEMPEQQALLRVSNSLAEPNGDASRRATAALLWQAINADPQEVMRTTVMLQKLERDLVQLRQGAERTRAEMAALRARVDQAQPWYLSPGFVQALLLLVLAGGVGAAVLWYRTRRAGMVPGVWYMAPDEAPLAPVAVQEPAGAREAVEHAEPEPVPAAQPLPPVQPLAPARPVLAEAAAPATAGPIDFDLEAAPEAPQAAADAMLRVETLAATLEEMDFLASLGLLSDAMDIVKAYLQDSARPAPLGYLALMQLCEKAEDPAAVAAVRRRYAQAFGVEAPRLAQITAEGGLDVMPELSARVTRAWGRPEALAVLEEALFSVPTPGAPMTLQAGRDLLSLHDLAMAQAAEHAGVPGGGELADAHALAPWAQGEGDHAPPAAAELAGAEVGSHFGLDLDLGAAVPEPLPESPKSELELVPMLGKIQADSAREAARRAQEEEDAFSAAVASERMPVSRY